MVFRAFIAVDLPPMRSLEALLGELKAGSPGLKVVAPDHLHVTVKFLGDTEDALAPEILEAMREACRGVPAFDLRVEGVGAFPNLHRMSVLWVALEGAEPLAQIARALDAGLVDFGYPREKRPWTAHVTLARVRGGGGLDRARAVLGSRAEERFGEVRVDEVRLKKSVLGPQGPAYTTVGAVRLEG